MRKKLLAAVQLGRLNKGVKKKNRSQAYEQAINSNIQKAIAARWPKKKAA